MDGETAQHPLERGQDKLRQQLTIIDDIISGFER
jgi:hypothetical protein